MGISAILSMNHDVYNVTIEDGTLGAKIQASFIDCLSTNDDFNRYEHVVEVTGFNPYSLRLDGSLQATHLTQEQITFELTRLFCLSLRSVSDSNKCSFHASTAVIGSGAICFSGVSGSGKTTLALLMSQYGSLMGDEYAVLDFDERTVSHKPFPLQIKEGSKQIIPLIDYLIYATVDNDAGSSSSLVPRSDMPTMNEIVNHPTPVKAIVFPKYNPNSSEVLLLPASPKRMPDLILKSIANGSTPSRLFSPFIYFVSEANVKLLTIDYSNGIEAVSTLLDYLKEL